jgi:excisionase family DNA binding protein
MSQGKVWTLEEACKLFRVCDKTIRKWLKLGRLQRVPDCRKVLITDESVRALAGLSAG